MSMWSEMAEQPEVIRRVMTVNANRIEQFVELGGGDVDHALIAARGTSDNAARYAQYAWGVRNRLSVGLAAPSLFGLYSAAPSLTGALVVGMSQSGQSPDVVEVLQEAGRQGRPRVAFTNDLASPLASAADLVIDLAAGEERSIAATKTYIAELAAVAMCSAGQDDPARDALAEVPGAVGRVLSQIDRVDDAIEGVIEHDRCVVVGRGFHHATAFEWALKLQELSSVLAQPFSAADFLHGPVAMVELGFPVLMVATGGAVLAPMAELARDLLSRGAHLVALTDRHDFPADRRIVIPAGPEWLAPLVAAPALQAFSRSLALAKGLDPEQPRGLSKVTRTR